MTFVSGTLISIVLSLQTLSTCVIFTLGQYIYTFYLQSYVSKENSTILTTRVEQCTQINFSSNSNAQTWAQQQSANLFFRINLWSFGPIIIMTYFLGLYTPRLGRRFVLLLPMFGIAIQMIIWLSIIYFHLAEYWWSIAAFIVGLTGSDNIRNFVLNLFITDSSAENERSSRFVLFGAIATIVSAVGTFVMGYYISWYGFTDLFWSALILQIISIVIVIFFFKSDHKPKLISLGNLSDSIHWKNSTRISLECFSMCQVFRFNHRSRKKSICLILTLIAYALYSFICTSFIVLLLYLLNYPFCWTSKNIGNYSAVALISFGVLSFFGMKILTAFSASDPTICSISHLFFVLASLWTAFAQSDWQMYFGLILCSFSGYQNFLTLSMISKWLHVNERTNAFTLVTEINTIMKMLGYCFFHWVYARTVMTQKNFTFLLASALSLIPLLLNIWLWFISRSMSDENNNEFDNEISVSTDWTTQIDHSNALLIPQQCPNLSRTNSICSVSSSTTTTIDV